MDYAKIEQKWQKIWEKEKVFKAKMSKIPQCVKIDIRGKRFVL